MSTTIRSRGARKALACLGVAAVAALAGCASSGSGAGTTGSSASMITVVGEPFGPFVPNYNPFSTSNAVYGEGATSLVYEPLMYFNILNPDQIYPWLATSWAWSNGGKTLTLQIRKGVKWSDGQPFTAADVAYTFQLLLKDPGLNVNGVVFKSASAPSPTEAVLTFAAPSYSELFDISQVLIVPEHIWSKISDPGTYADTSPVGTGPYTLQSFSTQQFTLTANPHYWQAGLPKIKTVRFVDYISNTSADLALEHGAVDWASLFIPHYQTLFVGADPTQYHVWLPATGNIFLCPNTARYPYNLLPVRQALSEAINRQVITTDGESGFYLPDNSPTGLVLPNWNSYLAPQYSKLSTSYDPSAAKALLEKAGFKPGANGMLNEPNGTPFKLQLSAPTPYTDWMTDTQLIVNELQAAGIDATVDGQSLSAWTNGYTVGDFDLTFCGNFTESGPFDAYQSLLDSSGTAPIGKDAVGDFERWNNAATDQYLAEYSASNNPATQLKAMQGIESIMVNDVPAIPLMSATAFGEYTTAHAVGWPTASDPYEQPDPATPWDEVVLLRLRPA
jgi:peptide/nickel transport system substrate-binding protein